MLAGTIIVLAGIAHRVFLSWVKHNAQTLKRELESEMANTLEALNSELRVAKDAAHNWQQRFRRAQRQWDFEETEELPEDYSIEEDMNLSDLARVVYPKLPPAVAKIIDQPGLQNALANTLQKHPDLIENLITKFSSGITSQGTNSNKTNQAYG